MKDTVRKILLVLSVLVFIASASFLIYKFIIAPMMNDKATNDIKDVYYTEEAQEEDYYQRLLRLREINEDISGWITINNTVVDYPVLVPPENDPNYYLKRDYNKNYTIYGSIFTSALGGVNPNYQNTILYGHHMNDGRMFAAIMNYSDLDFYKSAPIINFDTIYEPGKWKVISMFKTNTLEEQGERFDYLKLSFANTDDFLEFVYQIRVRSLLDIPVDIKDDDKLLTLSTCSYEMDDFRTVVVARKIRDGESEDIDLQKAKLSENPLMPEGWYKKYGGEAPKVTNFKNALANGEISWYVDSK